MLIATSDGSCFTLCPSQLHLLSDTRQQWRAGRCRVVAMDLILQDSNIQAKLRLYRISLSRTLTLISQNSVNIFEYVS